MDGRQAQAADFTADDEMTQVGAAEARLAVGVPLERGRALAAWLLHPLAAGAPPSAPAAEVDEIRPGVARVSIDRDGAQVVLAALDGSSLAGLVPGLDADVPCTLVEGA